MSETRKIGDIQVLRAIAILLVIVFNARWDLFGFGNNLFPRFYSYFGGGVGVDLFFVISGFVIARSLLPVLDGASDPVMRRKALIVFWAKRAFRLLPSAWFWLMATLLFALVFNQSGVFGSFRVAYEGMVAAVLNVANVRFGECFGVSECGPNFVYWSLSLEEQFYLVFPLVAFFLRQYLVGILFTLIATQLVESLSVPNVFRFSGLALGVLIAIFSRTQVWRDMEPESLARHRRGAGLLFAFLLILLATVLGEGLHIVSGSLKYDLVSFIAGALVLVASYDRDYLMRDGVFKRVMMWIGSRSYAMYLVHIPAFYLVREVFFVSNASFSDPLQMVAAHIALATVFIVIMSELSFQFVESYWQRLGSAVVARLSAKSGA